MTSWVLIRGLSRERGHWGSFPDELASALGGATVHALDLPGTGSQRDRPSPRSVAAMADALHAHALARRLPLPLALLGHSMGGMVATEWSLRHPAEIERVVLVNTSLRSLHPWWRRLRPASWLTLAAIASARDPSRAEQAVLRLTSAQPGQHGSAVADWLAIRQARPVARRDALRQLLAAACYAPADRPPVPVLVAAGLCDRLADPRCSRSLAQAWQAPLLLHPDAGHDLALDAGPWLATEITRWCAATS